MELITQAGAQVQRVENQLINFYKYNKDRFQDKVANLNTQPLQSLINFHSKLVTL